MALSPRRAWWRCWPGRTWRSTYTTRRRAKRRRRSCGSGTSAADIVSRAGWYASLPAATVATVRPGDEVDGLRQLLGAFLADPARFREMGRSGRELLLRSHAPKDYVSGLLEFAEELARDASPSIPVPLGGWGAFALREHVREATIKALAGWADQGPLHRMFKERVNKAMHELASSQRVSSRRPARRGTPLTISQHPLAAAA